MVMTVSSSTWVQRARQAGLAAVGGAVFWGLAALNAVLVAVSAAPILARAWFGRERPGA